LVTLRLPHPFALLLWAVVTAAALTWVLPAGRYDRRQDAATGRVVAVAGTYHAVPAAPVGPFAMLVAIPRGFIAAADVIVVTLFVGGAFVVVDRVGTLSRLVAVIASTFRRRGLWAVAFVSLIFATLGAIENTEEEIIPVIPVLLLLGRSLGVDAVTVVAMSFGASMVGSAFSPVNPFQAVIAMKLAQLPVGSGFGVRSGALLVAVVLWIVWTVRHAIRHRTSAVLNESGTSLRLSLREDIILVAVAAPLAAYVYGALRLDWGFNELGGIFFFSALLAGLVGGLGVTGTVAAFLEGAQSLLPATMLIGMARSISLVLSDGQIIDTILHALATPLGAVSGSASALLMIPFHSIVHVPVSSVSGQAVLTMPILVPLADLLGLSRQIPVLAYQTGAGLMELLTPTNGALMSVLLAANVRYEEWMRFVIVGWTLAMLVGAAAVIAVLWFGLA
jgi:uncharacterized ion transporter superfamily protein YfcC